MCCAPRLEVCSLVELPSTLEIGDRRMTITRGDAIGITAEGEVTHFALAGKKG
jgi:hypothetical protein